jgi:hypothetical protein
MTKNTLPAGAGEPSAAAMEYRVKPGVEWVNGKRIGNAKTVTLTASEAAFSLGNGQISPANKPEPPEWTKKPEAKASNDRD